jgi:hypothetical protein
MTTQELITYGGWILALILLPIIISDNIRIRRRLARMKKQRDYQDIRVVRLYRDGLMYHEEVVPIETTGEELSISKYGMKTGTNPYDVPPGTRITELDDRK